MRDQQIVQLETLIAAGEMFRATLIDAKRLSPKRARQIEDILDEAKRDLSSLRFGIQPSFDDLLR